ncbi:MAG: response regulator [Peptococcaceae bacterium]|jgi:two-component system response regulator (stage 0 sporulation protein F)|nr:response regulator [Peptococcaceae bacterium]
MSEYILVADDREGIRALLKTLLDDLGYQVQTVSNGCEAVELIQKETPQLVLMDLKMPELDGIQVMEAIRAEHPELPVILITGYMQDRQIQDALSKGLVQEVVFKPFDILEIGRKVERLLQKKT